MVFHVWHSRIGKVSRIFTNYLNFLSSSPNNFTPYNSILQRDDVKSYLDSLSSSFIICSVDKASNNYVFVCKKFYLLTLLNELGYDLTSLECRGNSTYHPVNSVEDDIIQEHVNFIKDNFNIRVSEDNLCLPRIFWIPKLHKNPYKSRFIAGASKCTTLKQISVAVNKACKVLKEYFSKYCSSVYNNTGINCDWSINSSKQFLERLPRLEIFNMQVYDFTTLYTNLDLQVVQSLLFELIDLLFSNTNKFICVSLYKNNNFFSKKEYNGYICFSADKLKTAITFILFNTFVCFGDQILRQTKGIPMGGNSSSQFADLSLGKCEFNYMTRLIKEKKFSLAKLLSKNCRYVDDLNTMNYLHFSNLIRSIYPPDLLMERSGDDNKSVNYLDINISMNNSGHVATKLYNKLDDFNFPVVMYTFPNSNISSSVGYNVFYGQVLRYSSIISDLNSFMCSTNTLYRTLLSRCYNDRLLKSKFRKLLKDRPSILYKYSILDVSDIFDITFNVDR